MNRVEVAAGHMIDDIYWRPLWSIHLSLDGGKDVKMCFSILVEMETRCIDCGRW